MWWKDFKSTSPYRDFLIIPLEVSEAGEAVNWSHRRPYLLVILFPHKASQRPYLTSIELIATAATNKMEDKTEGVHEQNDKAEERSLMLWPFITFPCLMADKHPKTLTEQKIWCRRKKEKTDKAELDLDLKKNTKKTKGFVRIQPATKGKPVICRQVRTR